MRKIISWLFGVSIGATVGAVIIALFVPETAEQINNRLKAGYQGALQAARDASTQRRLELEAQLRQLQGRSHSQDVTE